MDYLSLGEFRRTSWELLFQPVPLSLVFGIFLSAETSILKLHGGILHLSVTTWEGFILCGMLSKPIAAIDPKFYARIQL